MRNRPVYDVVALLARCGVGAVFLVHGWQKIQVGVTATARGFDAMGVPVPTAAAVYATFAELLGGAALILGLALPVAGMLLFLDMAGAFAFVNARHGVLLVDQGRVRNGFELVLVLGLAALLFAAGGGGRLTLDRRLFGPRRRGPAGDTAIPDGNTAVPGGGRPGGPRPGTGSPSATGSPRGGTALTRPAGTGNPADGEPGADTRDTDAPGAGGAGSTGKRNSTDAAGFDDLTDDARTTPVRRTRSGRGTTGTSRDVPVAGMRRPAADDGPPARPRKGGPAKGS